MRAPQLLDNKPLDKNDPNRLKVGTLQYTTFGLFALFAWLLWGDFCYTLHEHVVDKVLPLAFKRHNAPNWVMGLMMQSVAAVLNFTLNPIISTASDRTRTRWGRRIPYLVFSAPINAACLVLLAFSEQIGMYVADSTGWARAMTIVGVMAACLGLFRMTDKFVSTVYYYLFNDVVPRAYLARFTSMFRAVTMVTNASFNMFVYKYAENYMTTMMLAAAGIYMFGYTLMCLMVKEGQYPPPPPTMSRRDSRLKLLKTYFRECFTHKFYWYLFIYSAVFEMNRAASLGFEVFMYRDSLGLTLAQYGFIGGASMYLTALLLLPAGAIADKVHPLRFMLVTVVLQVFLMLLSCNWLFWNPTTTQVFYIYIGIQLVNLPLNAAHNAAQFPLLMRLLPKERFGQFASANAIVGAFLHMFTGFFAGLYLDKMVAYFAAKHGTFFGFRFIPVWQFTFMALSMIFLFLLYGQWKKLGGKDHFKPPQASDVDESASAEAQ